MRKYFLKYFLFRFSAFVFRIKLSYFPKEVLELGSLFPKYCPIYVLLRVTDNYSVIRFILFLFIKFIGSNLLLNNMLIRAFCAGLVDATSKQTEKLIKLTVKYFNADMQVFSPFQLLVFIFWNFKFSLKKSCILIKSF